MTKKNELQELKRYVSRLGIGIILIIIISTIFIVVSLPRTVCHDEYTTKRIQVTCGLGGIEIPANAERICDEGVQGAVDTIDYDNIVWDCNHDDVTRYCMYKEKKEVCEVQS